VGYDLEIDDGDGGDFVSQGNGSMSLQYTFSFANMAGKVLRSRYRVINAVGASEYSPIAYTRAAQVPAAPAYPPGLVSATDAGIAITLTRSADNGGSVITSHELWIDDGELGDFVEAADYDGYSVTAAIDAVANSLTAGKTYRIKYRAVNDVGESDFTGTTSIALANLPAKVDPPVRVDALSTDSKIVLQWTAPTITESPGGDVIGYRLEVDNGLGGDFTIVYDSANTPSLTQLVLGGSNGLHTIVTGRPYRMRLTARAFNGLAEASDITVIYSC
jgi:hypothetical protein